MKLLHIDSSISGATSVSRELSATIASAFKKAHRNFEVIRRDLDTEPLPHLDGQMLAAMMAGATPDSATRHELSRNAAVLEEFLSADVIVIGAPMYNFAISSQLKAWIDRIVIAGKTFRYAAHGPEGLAGGKTVVVASSRGGIYSGESPQAALDFQEAYLRAVFRFIGITNVQFVRAEGVALGAQQREAAVNAAIESVAATVGSFAPAKAA